MEPGEQLERQCAAEQPVERAVVLLGQRLGGRHQRGLGAVLDRPQHRVQRHDGLARADLAHQEPLHRPVAGEVRVDLRQRALLVAGELEGQRPAPAVHHHAAGVERAGAARLAARAPPPGHRQLEQQKLLEGEPPPRSVLVLLAVREVGAGEGGRALRQRLAHAQAARAAAPA